jgi:drebrin-like protein
MHAPSTDAAADNWRSRTASDPSPALPGRPAPPQSTNSTILTAIVQFDYTPSAQDTQDLALKEGETIYNIDMSSGDWWRGTNSRYQTGLFPSNYVKLISRALPPRMYTFEIDHVKDLYLSRRNSEC